MNFRVAVLQMRSVSGEVSKNLETIVAQMAAAAKEGADIVLLPECFVTGYTLPVDDHKVLEEDGA